MEALHLNEILSAVKGSAIWLKKLENNMEQVTISKVSTNSRDNLANGLFVPVIGERVDAHDFIKSAFENGAVACFTSRHKTIEDIENDATLSGICDVDSECIVLILVEDTLQALQALATYYRNRFKTPIVGISGSVGKTTTKEMISAALETKYNVLKTFGNMNSQIGVALMMFELDASKEVAVIEMGISEPHEMERLCSIAQPKVGVLTNIGVSHIANLKTRENIRKEKSKIANAFSKESVLFVNGNDDLLKEIAADYDSIQEGKNSGFGIDLDETTKTRLKEAKVVSFGTEEVCGFRAVDIQTEDEKTEYTLIYPEGEERIKLNVCGIHNVYNSLVALAVAKEFGIEPSVAKVGLEQYQPMKMRGQIFLYHGKKVIDDTYNASPDSMKSGVNVLLDLSEVTRRIAVLADVLELGEMSERCHYGVGEAIADSKIDALVTVGSQAKFIANALKDQKSAIETHSFATNQEAIDFLKGYVKPGDGILVKGSRGMHTEEIVAAIKDME